MGGAELDGDHHQRPRPTSQESSPELTGHDFKHAGKSAFPAILKGRRILLATESLGPVNGVSRTTGMLVDYLRENGVQVAVVAPRFESKKSKGTARTSPEVQVRLHGYPLPYNPDLTVVYPFRFDRVCQRTFTPDIVYLASPASVGFQFLLQLRQLRDPPVVLCNFQTDLSSYSEILFPAGLDQYAVWLLQVVQGFLFSHSSVSTIFYPSAGIRRYLEKAGAPSSKLVHLGRGVDTTLFNPSCRDETRRHELAPNGETILVCVCRLAPEKGFEFLAQVAVKLVEEAVPFKLLIVGGNHNASVEEEVQKLFDDVKDHVIFTGFLTGDTLARAYAVGDIFVHCSITETFGLVVLEAMASGVPVIARDQGGPSEIVRHQETGFLVPVHDRDAFVGRVRLLSQDAGLRSAMAVASRRVAEDTTWEKINNRVAGYLADGLEKRLQEGPKSRRPIRNWLAGRYDEAKSRVIVMLRINAAVGLVCLFWIIAVFPLILHGKTAFGRWRSLFQVLEAFSLRWTGKAHHIRQGA